MRFKKLSDLDYIVLRLSDWGRWRAQGCPGLSHSNETIESKIMEYGGSAPRATNPLKQSPNYNFHPREQAIDRIYRNLDTNHKLILWCQYVGRDGDGVSDEKKKSFFGIKIRQFYNKLGQAHEIVRKEYFNRKKKVVDRNCTKLAKCCHRAISHLTA